MTGDAADDQRQSGVSGEERLGELREHAQVFIAQAPGPLRSLRMRLGEALIEVEWHPATESTAVPRTDEAPPNGPASPDPAPGELATDSERTVVPAPLIGTFYRAPMPGKPPFVEVGDYVTPNQTIGIIEAMKLMNSVTAGCQGKVAEILADDGTPVEFGQPLIALYPEWT